MGFLENSLCAPDAPWGSLLSLAIQDFNLYLRKNNSLALKALCGGVNKVLNGPKEEFNLFLIPDGNARMAMLNVLLEEVNEGLVLENFDFAAKCFERKISETIKHPEHYISLIKEEYRANGFAASLIARELRRHSFGDQVTCIYNEINRQDREYFGIFEETLNMIGQANVDLLYDSGIKCFVVGRDAEKWAKEIRRLRVLSRPVQKHESRMIIVSGLYSDPKKAFRKLEEQTKKFFAENEGNDAKKFQGLAMEILGDVVDERLEKYCRQMNVFFRPTHARISGMYSSVYNDAAIGFSFLPFSEMNPASLAMQLLGAWKSDLERCSVQLDVYEPQSYALWLPYFKNKKQSPLKDFNVVLPCKRNPPIISKIARWKRKDMEKEISNYYKD